MEILGLKMQYTKELPPQQKENVYIGVGAGDWKQRYFNHTLSLRNQKHANDTNETAPLRFGKSIKINKTPQSLHGQFKKLFRDI